MPSKEIENQRNLAKIDLDLTIKLGWDLGTNEEDMAHKRCTDSANIPLE